MSVKFAMIVKLIHQYNFGTTKNLISSTKIIEFTLETCKLVFSYVIN